MRAIFLSMICCFFMISSSLAAVGVTGGSYTSSPVIKSSKEKQPADSTRLFRPAAPVSQQGYTMAVTAKLPTTDEMEAYIDNVNNFCSSPKFDKNSPLCVVRYVVEKGPNDVAPYKLLNKNLECPKGYIMVATMDNKAFDPQNPKNNIYYYPSESIFPATQDQFNAYKGNGCEAFGPVVEDKEYCYWCYGRKDGVSLNGFSVRNNFSVKKIKSNIHKRDTYTKYYQKCQHYKDDGCSWVDWCGKRDWEHYEYKQVKCNRPKGFYKESSLISVLPSSEYSPTVVICGKPVKNWQPPQ